MLDVHPDAHAVTVFRVLPSGEGREYTATTFPRDPWQGCERLIRTAWKLGYITPTHAGDYAVLDVLSDTGDIVQDFSIEHARGFQWIKRHLHLAVEREPEPAALPNFQERQS